MHILAKKICDVMADSWNEMSCIYGHTGYLDYHSWSYITTNFQYHSRSFVAKH